MSPRERRGSLGIAFFLGAVFFSQAAAASIPCIWSGVERIVAVGDLHGNYDDFSVILKGTKVVDDGLRWIAGKTHLVQLGDILDRGPDARKIFSLLMRLEKEATDAGGMVHVLLGNHEEMNLTRYVFDYGDYVTPEQFMSFIPDGYRQKKLEIFAKHIAGVNVREIDTDLSRNPDLKVFWEGVIAHEAEARQAYFRGFMSFCGKWLLGKNAVIKINDVVFVHGGISPAFASWSLDEINEALRWEIRSLSDPRRRDDPQFVPRIVFRRDGPLWYRNLAFGDEREIKNEVDKTLAALKAGTMVIAHTYRAGSPVSMEFMARAGKRVWIIDTGIYGHNPSALIIENGKFSVWGDENEKQVGLGGNPGSLVLVWNLR